MNTCEYVGRVGYDWLSEGGEGVAHVIETLLSPCEPIGDSGQGVRWLGRDILWPERVPGIKVWAGNMTLAGIVAKHQTALARDRAAITDLFEWGYFGTGISGLDSYCFWTAIDVGFSLHATKTPIRQRGAIELLAVLGMERCMPAWVAPNRCAFSHVSPATAVMRELEFVVVPRGGYYRGWGELRIFKDHLAPARF